LERAAALTLVAAQTDSRRDAGTLHVGANDRLITFQEKSGIGNSINAGIYLIQRGTAEQWHFRYPFSLERDVMPELALTKLCFAYNTPNEVTDIGTPDRYRKVQSGLPRHTPNSLHTPFKQ
jgi:NDP-sugar pyrophosphorylase family protein